MQPSSREAHLMRRLSVFCLLAISILFVVASYTSLGSGHTDWVIETEAGTFTRSSASNNDRWKFRLYDAPTDNTTISSPNLTILEHEAPESSVAADGNYTLNKFVFPGSTTFTSVSPTLLPMTPQIGTWSIGVPILYVITIGNSNPSQNTPVDITLTDDVTGGLGGNFVLLSVQCTAINQAYCPPNLPAAGTPMPLVIPNIGVRVGGSNDVVIQIRGYYKTANTFKNIYSVVETQNPTVGGSGNPKSVQITNDWSAIDLGLTKISSTTDTSLPATIHYTVTLTGDSSEDFYPTGLLRVQDYVLSTYPPSLTYTASLVSCVSSNTLSPSTCPTISTGTGSLNPDATIDLLWLSASSVITKGDTLTIKFDITVDKNALCGPQQVTIKNSASLQMSGFASYSDSNKNNLPNSTPNTSDTFSTGLNLCQPVATATKSRVCSSTPCPQVNFGDKVTYQIVVQNNTNVAQTLQVNDDASKPSTTIPLKATLVPSGSPPKDVQCSPSIISCTTTSFSPQNVVADLMTYSLFQTRFTLAPKNTPGDTVTLTFDVQIDKLSECEMDTGNDFTNGGTLWAVSSGSTSTTTLVGNIAAVNVALPPKLPICKMNVDKKLITPVNGVTFGQPVSFTITYENLEPTQAVTINTLRDYLNMRDASNASNLYSYGSIPINNTLSASCSQTGGVSPANPLLYQSPTQISASNYEWKGIPVFQEAGPITFPANSKLTCSVTFTPGAPSPTDALCQGTGQPEIVNSTFLDVSGLYEYSVKPSAPFLAQASASLPLCRKVKVLKEPVGASTTGPNGVLTFQITVTNLGNDPVSNFVLNDPLPLGFSPTGTVTCVPAPACQSAGFTGTTLTGTTLNVAFNSIPGTKSPPNSVSVTFHVNASLAGGTYFNTATGSFPADPHFYFEGDPTVLLVNGAQVQVLTPTLSKSFNPTTIGVNGNSTLTFTITNQNSDPAQTGISFTDLLPSGVTVTSAPSTACGSGTVTVSGGNTITLTGGGLSQGVHTCQFSVDVKASLCGSLVNDKSHFPTVTNLDVTNASDTLTVTGCLPGGSPTLAKQFAAATIGPSGTTTLTFNITNSTGDPKQSGISFSDTLPVGLQFLPTPTSTCGSVSISPDGLTIMLAGGSLVGPNPDGSGNHACQITVAVKATGVCDIYQNNKTNFSDVNNLDISNIDQQLEVVGCAQPALCAVKTDQISCKTSGVGGYLYTFTVTNNTGKTVTDVLLTPLAGSSLSIMLQQPPLPAGGLVSGASLTLQTTISGGPAKQVACINVTLMTKDGTCCTVQVCPVLPDCCAAIDGNFKCGAKGTYSGGITITNNSSSVIKNIYLYPPPGVSMSQTYFAVALAPGQSFTTPVITISGASPGKLCFRISMHTADMKECCVIEQCIMLPDCGTQIGSVDSIVLRPPMRFALDETAESTGWPGRRFW